MEENNVVGAFSEQDAARLTGLSIGQLQLWDRSGFLQSSFAPENRRLPYSRVYSFRDIVSLRVLGQLRNIYKVPMQHLRKVSQTLAHYGDAKWTATTLYVLGKRVVFTDPRTNERKEVVSGQRVFDIPLRVAISDTRKAIQSLNSRSDKETGHIVQAKFVLQNEPVFDKTRIPVAAVKRYLEAGYSPQAIIREFPSLTAEDVSAAAKYVLPASAA
jgi:uncharacterized protein (DUF433 family)